METPLQTTISNKLLSLLPPDDFERISGKLSMSCCREELRSASRDGP